jgi:DNA-binding transcriptional ArsR family regulator
MTHRVAGPTSPAKMTPEVASRVAEVMRVLAAASRVLILGLLRERPHTVSELASAIGMEQSAVSQQLRVLRDIGLVVGERRGRRVVYSLCYVHVAELIDHAVGHAEDLQLSARKRPPRHAA